MKDPAIMERFIELAGGSEVPIVVIPTAGGGDHYDQYYTGFRQFKEAGAKNITVLHTKDRAVPTRTSSSSRSVKQERFGSLGVDNGGLPTPIYIRRLTKSSMHSLQGEES